MVITIEFADGRTREYNMASFCASDPWSAPREGRFVVTTELDLRCDLLMRPPDPSDPSSGYGSLRVDVIRHELGAGGDVVPLDGYVDQGGRTPTIDVPLRIPTASIQIASAEEMQAASVVYVSSGGQHKAVAWRQGSQNWIINGVRFEAARRLFYTDAIMTSTNDQAIRLFHDLVRDNPGVDEEAVANMLGYPLDAIREVVSQRAASAEDDVEQGSEGESAAPSAAPDAPLVDMSSLADDDDEDDE